MKEIPLTQGKVALVDDEDYDWLNQWKWYATRTKTNWYAARKPHYRGTSIFMHRIILGTPTGMLSDHKNHNGLDNRRQNLRICTSKQNSENRRPLQRRRASKYKGVCWTNGCPFRPWRSFIYMEGKQIYLGSYKTEVEAAQAYDKAAKEHFGEFACLNFKERR